MPIFFIDMRKYLKSKLFIMAIFIPMAIAGLLFIDFSIRYESYLIGVMESIGLNQWELLLKEQRILFFKEFLPVFIVLILFEVMQKEFKNNSFSFLLTMPRSKTSIYLSKLLVTMFYVTILLMTNIIALFVVGIYFNFDLNQGIPYLLNMFGLQWVSAISIICINLFLFFQVKKPMNLIAYNVIACVVSNELYYGNYTFNRFNLYSFACYADGLKEFTPSHLILISFMMFVMFLGIGSYVFKRKDVV